MAGVCGENCVLGKKLQFRYKETGTFREGYREFVDFGTIFLEGIVGGQF